MAQDPNILSRFKAHVELGSEGKPRWQLKARLAMLEMVYAGLMTITEVDGDFELQLTTEGKAHLKSIGGESL